MKMMWETNDPECLSQLARLEKLNGKGYGCAKLLNARVSKPSETVMLVMPPATAMLKTAPGSKDRVLIVTFRVAPTDPIWPSYVKPKNHIGLIRRSLKPKWTGCSANDQRAKCCKDLPRTARNGRTTGRG